MLHKMILLKDDSFLYRVQHGICVWRKQKKREKQKEIKVREKDLFDVHDTWIGLE